MACETKEQEINGALYVATQWPASKSLLMKFKLLSTFGDSIFELVAGITVKEKDEAERNKKQLAAFKRALSTLSSNSTPEQIVTTLKTILEDVKREGKRITLNNFDEVYNDAGLSEMYQACMFVLKTNYSDFFGGQKARELLAQAEENR